MTFNAKLGFEILEETIPVVRLCDVEHDRDQARMSDNELDRLQDLLAAEN
ncbi:hypothetical protein FHR20_002307 [Sphingomonas leidyi]|uniref:Uncharacterized protein n=1 Tax=Sphingomonas leidyi TaxID=68569 RepID=A0A7X5UZY1_9SPHN|nr:hypothetical protein [Sphingomonas leidyi]NIJ65345.1 hypothetical protein [Sphingomonas leidyi]